MDMVPFMRSITTAASGKDPAFRLRLPKKVLRAITARAKKNRRSRNTEIVLVLAQAVGLDGAEEKPAEPPRE